LSKVRRSGVMQALNRHVDGCSRRARIIIGESASWRAIGDVTCPDCRAGYRRIELMTRTGTRGEFRST
jgi:hypothetical protein